MRHRQKHTKIVATISDRRCDVPFLTRLYEAGMNVVRINTAHQDIEGSKKVITAVREVSDEIAILIDTKGPEIRTNIVRDPFEVQEGQSVQVEGNPELPSVPGIIRTNYEDLVADIKVGDIILIDDGDVKLTVLNKDESALSCVANNTGLIKSRKSVNVPGVKINLPSVSEKDKEYIRFAVEQDIEFIAHSFVRSKNDVLDIQSLLDKEGSAVKIIAKIENQEGVDNIDEILDYAYGVMVARGDLGIEIPAERIPGIQRKLLSSCINRKKPVIIATQMLHTMIEHPRPTRAEISDVANAIYNFTDAIMLSGETAYGKYPVEAVETMTRVAIEVESARELKEHTISSVDNEIAAFLANATLQGSQQLSTKAIICDTLSGRTARYLSALRNRNPVYAACYSQRVKRELALSYGVFSFYMEIKKHTDAFKRAVVQLLVEGDKIRLEDRIMMVGGSFGPRKGATFLEIGLVKDLIQFL